MAWYHVYQYAEVDVELYPTLRGKALPITQYEITDDPKKIVSVKVQVAPGNFVWFDRKHVRLYKSGKDLSRMIEKRHNEGFVNKTLRILGLNKF